MEFFTIGVYNSTEQDFFNKLISNGVDTFCDIRQRRGVRGSKYAFVNSNRLQEKLKSLGVEYLHVLKLAPNHEIRDLQKEADAQNREAKRERQQLGDVFKKQYENNIIKEFDFENFLSTLDVQGANKIALFCVEERPEACHRSIVSNKLKEYYNYKITHL